LEGIAALSRARKQRGSSQGEKETLLQEEKRSIPDSDDGSVQDSRLKIQDSRKRSIPDSDDGSVLYQTMQNVEVIPHR